LPYRITLSSLAPKSAKEGLLRNEKKINGEYSKNRTRNKTTKRKEVKKEDKWRVQ
jgi:hypothetical protein